MNRPGATFGLATLVLSLLLWPGAAAAQQQETLYEIRQPGAFGLGLGVGGRAAGLGAKYFVSNGAAVQGVLGFRSAGRNRGEALAFSLDYLFEGPLLLDDPSVGIAWSVGPGVYLGTAKGEYPTGEEWRELWLGAGPVLGLELLVRPSPVDVVLEYRPDVQILPTPALNLVNFGGHIRYFFGTGGRGG